ncbi:flagellar biosynthesis protein FlhB [Helicobacter sp.]|uniref:flagellar biosynthesis protein FlhB n=1 Tax=Helicobacter sp. TaxID=218 RepID=UPI0025B84B2D|nr:flagellar biosynthesis protein FlhB [Helicobacter sp.]MCI5968833.1 flagellar biosynthesis protein FlhB [Helicobacter sp.]MDY2585018.1 flagellar biosynthesis protein FlhB [Helicobacter sp.]
MADEEKTEAPTGRRIQKAREEGNVIKSPDVNAFLGLVVGLALVFLCFNFWVRGLGGVFEQIYQGFSQEFTRSNAMSLTLSLMFQVLYLLAPIFGALMLIGVIANISQSGFLLTTKAIQPKLQKLNFIMGLKNLITLKKLLDGFLITFKVLTAFVIAFFVFLGFMHELTTIALLPLGDQMLWFRDKAIVLIGILLAFFLVMASVDYMIKRYQYFKSLRMSKQEVKDEFKNQEGDQQVKGKIRSLMFQAARKRMLQNIPSADVVVTNPTHYAVALRYDNQKERAPRVLAKGVDFLAQRIKEIATEHAIPIIENPPLARALYKDVELDKEIPESLYQAMVNVLLEVQRINDGRKSA